MKMLATDGHLGALTSRDAARDEGSEEGPRQLRAGCQAAHGLNRVQAHRHRPQGVEVRSRLPYVHNTFCLSAALYLHINKRRGVHCGPEAHLGPSAQDRARTDHQAALLAG